MTKTILILAIVAAFVAGTIATTGLVYAHGGDINLIHACVSKKLGIIRIVDPSSTCTKFENPLDWSVVGVQGPQGEKGDKGDVGDAGLTGPPGTISAQTCPSGQFTTGFSSSGEIICSLIAETQVNHTPVVNAGNDQDACKGDPNSLLSGSVSDDGLPAGGTLTQTWSMVSGPSTVTFSDPNSLTPIASYVDPGVYVLRLTASDSQLTSSDEMSILVGNCAG